jgi:hypothetical protein
MKKVVLALMLVSASLFAKTHLGGAYSLSDCADIAGSYGYRWAVYGPGYDDRGVYYPYVNACFGSHVSSNPGPAAATRYHVVARYGSDLTRCAEDITWEVSDVRCRVVGANIQCMSNSGNRQYQIERVSCVSRVFPYLTRDGSDSR